MSHVAPSINLTEKQETYLTAISKSRSLQRSLIYRAQIILYASKGMKNIEIALKTSLYRKNVGIWRKRWAEAQNTLLEMEQEEENNKYYQKIQDILTDQEKPGVPAKFTAEQICQILAVACEKPEDSGLPLSHWSRPALREELIKRGIVETISVSHLGYFLKSRGH
jgi:hypothetical protein